MVIAWNALTARLRRWRASAAEQSRRQATADLFALVAGQRHLLLRFAVTSLGRTALVMATVLLMREFLSVVGTQPGRLPGALAELLGRDAALWVVALLLVSSYVGASLLYYDNQVARQRLVRAVELGLIERLVRHLLTLSVGFFERTSHGDLVHAVRQDVADVRVIVLSAATLLMEGAVAVGLLVVAAWLSPALAFWALFVLPLASVPLVVIARRTRARSFAERSTSYRVFDVVLQLLRGIRIIKVYQGEERELRATLDSARRHFDEQLDIVRIRELSNVVLESLAGFSVAAVIIAGGVQVTRGALDWPHLLAFLMAVRMLHGPLDHINTDIMMVQRHRAAAQRILALLRERSTLTDTAAAQPFPGPPRQLAVDGVSFRYGERLVLDRVSVAVRAGETLGIAGPSGSGKTTLLSLIARFSDPMDGRICLDGRDLRSLPLHDLYRQLAMVTQEPFLFEASVRENIRCGRPQASDAEVEAAARGAEIHDEILALPSGYDTIIGVGGRGLSAGQAQRINIARALVKNAPILLLDEATSNLDSIAELQVQRAIDRLQAGRTCLIVAHRLSSLRSADRILVLDAGRCIGLGRHDQLLRQCRIYRQMWETQQLGDRPLRAVGGESAPSGDPIGTAVTISLGAAVRASITPRPLE
jgi:subfamily B ATP-binding cassette protein MsbA